MGIPFLDRYSAEARILPSLAVAAPGVLTVLGLYPPARSLGSVSVVATAGAVAVVVLSHLVRSWGRAKEQQLYRKWGGPPTTRRLRHRSAEDPGGVAELHRAVQVLTGRKLPDAEAEARDPETADSAYAAAVGVLRELTRDAARFPVVVAENASYGMRRNLLGARDWGRIVSALGLIAGLTLLLLEQGSIAATVAVIVLNLTVFAFWQWIVLSRWVRESAELYADALFRAALAMSAGRG